MSGAQGPLTGRTILITRPRAQAGPLSQALRQKGAATIAVPTIAIAWPRRGGPLDERLQRIESYDWVIVTSANGVRAVTGRARALRIDLTRASGVRWAAIGAATREALCAAGIRTDFVPSRFLTDTIAAEIPLEQGDSALLPRADAAGPELAALLRRRGAVVDEVTAYRTVVGPASSRERLTRALREGGVDTVVLTSASTVRGLVRLLGDARHALRGVTVACIGPVTARAAVEEGLVPSIVAEEHTAGGIVRALLTARTARRGCGTKGRRKGGPDAEPVTA